MSEEGLKGAGTERVRGREKDVENSRDNTSQKKKKTKLIGRGINRRVKVLSRQKIAKCFMKQTPLF